MNWCFWGNLALVFIFGVIWGLLELMLRFNDWKYILNCKKKKKITDNDQNIVVDEYERTGPYVIWYLLLNGLVALLSLYLLKIIEDDTSDYNIDISDILIAGFGGVVLLRSSLMSISVKNSDVTIGLISVVDSFMSKISSKINHNIAAKRICDIYEIMKDVDYDKAKDELPILCMNYIDYFPEEDQRKLIEEIKDINIGLENLNKSLQLGRVIAKYCDLEILKRAVKKLPNIKVLKTDQSNASSDVIKDVYEIRKEKLSKQWKQKEK